MKLKNDPYFPFVALAIIAALIVSLLSPRETPDATAPANTVTASAAAIVHAD